LERKTDAPDLLELLVVRNSAELLESSAVRPRLAGTISWGHTGVMQLAIKRAPKWKQKLHDLDCQNEKTGNLSVGTPK
jgi:hypothetical protein